MVDQTTIYWDHCATTPPSSGVVDGMTTSLKLEFANPSSSHQWGAQARDHIEDARVQLAQLIGARARDITFTSGATEANNLAIFGVAAQTHPPIHIITQQTEHDAVLAPLKELKRQGHTVTTLPVDHEGLINLEHLADALTPKTRLISIMHVNNETGTQQPIEEIVRLIRSSAHPHCLIHVDAAQSVGKIPIDLRSLNADLLSLSAHKFYGPKGVGALYARRTAPHRPPLKLPPLVMGGSQERGLRPGTLPTHQIVGLGIAAQEAMSHLNAGGEQIVRARCQQLYQGLKLLDPSATRRGALTRAPHVLSVTLAPRILERIQDRWGHVAFSRGSACQSTSGRPSPVLTAMGMSSEEAARTLRFGLGRGTTSQEIDQTLDLLT